VAGTVGLQETALSQTVRQAIDCMIPVADGAGVHLIHDDTQVEIAADPDRLLQVLTNLLSNAVKFSPRNSTVSVLMRPDANGVTISVVDPGRGIPADKLETIFGRFQQVDASDSRQKVAPALAWPSAAPLFISIPGGSGRNATNSRLEFPHLPAL